MGVLGLGALPLHNDAVCQHRRGHFAHHGRVHIRAPADAAERARHPRQAQRAARAGAEADVGVLARGPHDGSNELRHLRGDGHLVRPCHQPLELAGPAHRLQSADGVRELLALDQARFGIRVGVAQRKADEEAVELRLWQRVSARHVDGVLRSQHGERCWQRQGLPVQRDLPLLHAFEQGRLGARVGTIDLVSQHDVGKDGAGAQREAAVLGVVDRPAHDV